MLEIVEKLELVLEQLAVLRGLAAFGFGVVTGLMLWITLYVGRRML